MYESSSNAPYKDAAERFATRHGGEGLQVVDRGLGGRVILYRTGAYRVFEEASRIAGTEPPRDLKERNRLIILWHEESLRRTAIVFNELRAQLHHRAAMAQEYAGRDNPPEPPYDHEIEELKTLLVDVRAKQALLAQMRAELGVPEESPEQVIDRENSDLSQRYADKQFAKIEKLQL